jgi:hypothetical protein
LEVYDRNELQEQLSKLQNIRNSLDPKASVKNTRRALARQIEKVRRFVGEDMEWVSSSGDFLILIYYYALLCMRIASGKNEDIGPGERSNSC